MMGNLFMESCTSLHKLNVLCQSDDGWIPCTRSQQDDRFVIGRGQLGGARGETKLERQFLIVMWRSLVLRAVRTYFTAIYVRLDLVHSVHVLSYGS